MNKSRIIISSGCLPFLKIESFIRLANQTGYDGIEYLPTRLSISEIKNAIALKKIFLKNIKCIHQNWRLDLGKDKTYDIKFPTNIFFTLLRFFFYPNVEETNNIISSLSNNLHLSVTVHDLSSEWTKNNNQEYLGGISYEMIRSAINLKRLKIWMNNPKHNFVIDSRDDQSTLWAKRQGFKTWKIFWRWITLDKIKSYQLTFIGFNGLKKILKHEPSLPEKQLLWLHKNNWNGEVVAEVNPLVVLFLCRGNFKNGLEIINQFARQTLIEGKKWS